MANLYVCTEHDDIYGVTCKACVVLAHLRELHSKGKITLDIGEMRRHLRDFDGAEDTVEQIRADERRQIAEAIYSGRFDRNTDLDEE